MANIYKGRCDKALTKDLLEMLNEVFFSEDPEENRPDFLSLLPKLYKEKYNPAYNNIVIMEDDKIKGAVGLFPMDVNADGMALKIGGIGNVASTKDSRGKGYMIECMNACLDIMKEDGTDYSVLNGQRQRYGHFGYEPGGYSYSFMVNRGNIDRILGKDAKASYTWKKLTEDDAETVSKALALYNKNIFRYERTNETFCDILMSWGSTPYAFFDGEEFKGYASINGNGSINEIEVCETKDFFEVLMCIMEISGKKDFHISVAPFKKELCEYLGNIASVTEINQCHCICIFNYARFIKAFLSLKAKTVSVCNGSVVLLIHGIKKDEKLEITVDGQNVTVEETEKPADIELEHNEAELLAASIYSGRRLELPAFAQSWFPVYNYAGSEDNV